MSNLLLVKQFVATHFDVVWAWIQFGTLAAYITVHAAWTNRHEKRLRALEERKQWHLPSISQLEPPSAG